MHATETSPRLDVSLRVWELQKTTNYLFPRLLEEGFELVQLLVIIVSPLGEPLGNYRIGGGLIWIGGRRKGRKALAWIGGSLLGLGAI